jgi:drug/metabolite transporter (DMT)-like permease
VSFTVFLFAAASALLHACWNMLAQRHSAPRDVLYGITLATAIICGTALPFVGPAAPVTWPWIAAASLCNILYLRALGAAYAHPDFCAVYGAVRAIVPALLFLCGWLALSEPARLSGFAGLAIVATSILIFAAPWGTGRRIRPKILFNSVLAGTILALALFCDIKGIRAGGGGLENLIRYAVGTSLATAAGLALLAVFTRTNLLIVLIDNGRRCFPGALLLLFSYLCGMWAYVQGPVGLVAPVRESSLLFGGALTVFVLRQRVTKVQWTAMVLATFGMVLLQVG